MRNMPLPLEDVTVLDLSHALAGPFASTLLGDYGANVIKIEPPDRGDMSRGWGPPFYGDDSTYFVSLNHNKRSVTIDLKHPRGKDLFFRLLDRADVVLENMRPGAVQKLGIGYESARARQPRIIYCSVSGFGQDGPYRDRAALDLIVQAESGLISMTGDRGGRGARCGVSIADINAGMFAALGITMALHARTKSGRGQFLDVSLFDGQLSIMVLAIGAYLANGVVPRPMGTAYGALLPYETFRTKTRDIAIAIGSEKLWRDFCPLVGLAHLTDDSRYASNAARNANRDSLTATLEATFTTKTCEEWEAILAPAGIPVGGVNTVDQIAAHPQVKARGALVETDHPTAGRVKVVAPPIRMSESPTSIRIPPPQLGQHTDEVLREQLGLAASEIQDLRQSGALGPSK